MAHIYRLIFLVFILFSSSAHSSPQCNPEKYPHNNTDVDKWGFSWVCKIRQDGWTDCGWNFSGKYFSNGYFYNKCSFKQIEMDDFDKCAAWNNKFNSMPSDDAPTDADGYRPVGKSSACFNPDYDSFNPDPNPLTPGKGCVMNFDREIAWQNRDDPSGKWWSRGKFSTVPPQVCDLTDYSDSKDPKEESCPEGYEKSKYADVCIPLEKKDANCPDGYEPSQYVPNICIPKESKPDPFDPDPTKPGGPGPISPGPGGTCPDGYTRDGGSCFKTPKPGGPGPVNPDPGGDGGGGGGGGVKPGDPGPVDPTNPVPCPEGQEKNSTGQCVPKSGQCPEGQEKNSQGQCVPKTTCDPDPKWPEKCTPCEKDALNPNICKEDPGECKPDPAVPDKCGEGGGGEGSFGGTCEAGFTCKGDVIQCAIAKEQHMRGCRLFDTKNAESQLYDKEKGKEGDQTKDLKGNENINMANRIDTSDAFGGGGSGVQDLSITVMGQSITLPFSKINSGLDALGRVLVAVSFLIALRIVGRG